MATNSLFVLNEIQNETQVRTEYEEGSALEKAFSFTQSVFSADSMKKEMPESSTFVSKQKQNPWLPALRSELNEQILRRKQRLASLTTELVTYLKYFSVDDSEMSVAERKILEIEEKYSFQVLGEILQRIYVDYFDCPQMLAGICKGLARFDAQEVYPWGQTMLTGLLGHKDEMVLEYAVTLVENWADASLLGILRGVNCQSQWLREYVGDIVEYLEGCNVLHKKVI